jgi:subtilase family serine protease
MPKSSFRRSLCRRKQPANQRYAFRRARLEVLPLEERVMLAADLLVTSVQAAAAAVVGNNNNVSVTWTVKNQGDFAPAQHWRDSFYLSSKNTVDGSATLISSVFRNDNFPLPIGGTYTSTTQLNIPNTTLAGNNFLLVVANSGTDLAESDKTNNVFAAPLTLSAPNVDLAISNPSVSSPTLVAGNGSTVTVSWTVKNLGAVQAAANWSDAIYLSSKTTFDNTAVLVNSFSAPKTLNPSDSYSQSQSITVPNTTLLGNENILIVANAFSAQSETSSANDTATLPVTVSAPSPAPNLQVTSFAAPASAILGQSVPVSWTVKNTGSVVAAVAWTDVVYSSPTSTFNSSTAHFVNSFFNSQTLAAGASYTLSRNVTLGANSAGDSFLFVVTDAFNSLAESNENDNSASSAIALTEPNLAIVASSFQGPASANLGDLVFLQWAVKNTSSVATAASWNDAIYISSSSTYDSSALLVKSFTAPIAGSLAAGASYTQTESVSLPYVQTGNRFLLLVADQGGAQPITGALPLVASTPISLGAPDLALSAAQAPASAILGAPFSVSWTVSNVGSVAAKAAWEDQVFVSSSPTFDPVTAQLLTTVQAPSSLAVGGSYTSATNLQFPSLAAGNYFLYFVADRNNDQGESNESTNNVVQKAISVTGPDLTVQILHADAAAISGNGATVNVQWKVTNNSDVDAVGSWSDSLYLSTTPNLDLTKFNTYWSLSSFPEPLRGALNAHGSYTTSQNVTIPNVAGPGTYYLIVLTNPNANFFPGSNSQSEIDINNNQASAPITLTIPAVSLSVTNATPTTTTVVAGSTISLTYTVKNTGTDAAKNSWSDAIYLSTKQTFDNTATEITSFFHNPTTNGLAANASYSGTLDLSINTLTGGSQYLFVVPNAFNHQAVSSPSTPFVIPLTITLPDVKLATTILNAASSGAMGASIPVSWKVTNNGTAATTAPSWSDVVYLSPTPTYDSSTAYFVGSVFISNQLPLAPGNTYTANTNVTLPNYLSAGTYFLLIKANSSGSQPQSDGSQSVASMPFTLTGSGQAGVNADLIVSTAAAPSSATPGSSLPVSFTVKNQGTAVTAGASWSDAVYLSNTPSVNSYSTFLTSFSNSAPLAGGGTYTLGKTINLPTSSSVGSRYLVFVTNVYGAGGGVDINTANNSFALPILVTAPDLVVMAASLTGAPVEGTTVKVDWTVQNQGAAPTAGAWSDAIYLSDTPTFGSGAQIQISSFTAPGQSSVAPQGTYHQTQNVTLPLSTVGSRYLLIVSDAFNGEGDTNRTNNVFALPLALTAPNLALSNVVATPATVEEGNQQTLNISWKVTNTSSVNAGQAWTDSVYLSTSPTFDFNTATFLTSAGSQAILQAGASYTTILTNVNIDVMTPANYYVFVVANSNYVQNLQFSALQPETDPTDNVVAPAQPISITAPAVNLQVSNPSIPNTPLVIGQSVNISFQVTNAGSEAAASSWSDEAFISKSATFDNTAQSIGSNFHPAPLAGGANYTQSISAFIPDNLAAGTYYIYFEANAFKEQGETSFDDNVTAGVQVTINAPDLVISATNPPTTLKRNDALTLGFTVTNNGSFPAYASWSDAIYLSTKPTYDNSATFLTSVFRNNFSTPLAAGGHYDQTATVSIPSGSLGNMYLLYFADAFNSQGETSEANNVQAVPVTLVAPDVNLQIVPNSLTAPGTASTGTPLTVSWSAKNTGADAANGTWQDYLYLSTSSTFDSTAQRIATASSSNVTPVAGGGTYNQSTSINLPSNTTAGSYFLFVVANGDGGQSETNATDNTSAGVPITVTAPNLQVSAVAVQPTSSSYGSNVQLSYTVTNNGAGSASGSWYDAVYLSKSSTYDSSAQFLTSFSETHTLAAGGGQYQESRNVTLSSLFGTAIAGDVFIIVVTNVYGSIAESNANDNSGSAAMNLTAPDLVPTALTGPTSAIVGDTISVSWTIKNQGTAASSSSWSDALYISPNNFLSGSAVLMGSFTTPQANLAIGDSYTQTQSVVLPSTFSGPEYLLIVADGFNSLGETDETNNVKSQLIQISAADLTTSAVTAPATGLFGQPISVSWTVSNSGTGSADAAWSDGVYLSKTSSLDASAILLGDIAAGSNVPLAAGGSYNQTAQVTLPLTVNSTAGTYFIVVKADDKLQQAEVNENNNVAASAGIAISLPPLPDLVVAPNSISAPATAYNNSQILVSWTDANNGTASATGPWIDKVFYSTSSDGSNPVLLGSFSFAGNLAVGASAPIIQPVTLPATIGNIWIVVQTDADQGAVEGIFSQNNTTVAAAPIAITQQPLPDLVASNIVPPSNGVLSATSVPVSFTITNTGTAPTSAPVWRDWVVLSQDPNLAQSYYPNAALGNDQILNNQPVILGFDNLSYLDVGQSYTQTVDIPLPVDAQGTWYIYVVPDGTGNHHQFEMPELSRADKLVISSGFSVTASPAPALVVNPVIVPLIDFSGQPTNVSWKVTNQGPGPTFVDSWTDAVYMSTKNTFDSSAIALGQYSHQGALAVGTSYRQSQSVTLPVGVSGSYYFLVVTDTRGEVFQNGNTAGNVGVTPAAATVNLTPPPDLKVAAPTAPPTGQASHGLTFTYQVNNNGAGATAKSDPNAAWVDSFYLSSSQTFNASSAILLGTLTHSGVLNAGANYQNTVTETVPDGVSGSYYLVVVADSGSAIFEIDQVGKIGVTAMPLLISSKPADLAVSASGPATGNAGAAAVVHWSVANQGAGDTAVSSWFDYIYAETTATLDHNGIYLGAFPHTGLLNPGESYSQAQLVALPINLKGAYNLFVVTNRSQPGLNPVPPAPVYETNLANNVSAALPITISQNLADLQVTTVSAPANPSTGASVTVSWTVKNAGAGATNANFWYDDVWLSTKASIQNGGQDTYLATLLHTNPLAAGASYAGSVAVTIPSGLAAGTYSFIVVTDRPVLPPETSASTMNLVFESSETNNQAAASPAAAIVRGATPNLAVSNVGVITPATVGGVLSVSWKVINNGVGTGHAITDYVFLSFDQNLSPSDRFLGSVTTLGGLPSGGSYTQNADLQLPTGLAGTFYVFVVANGDQGIFENDRTAGTSYGSTPVAIKLPLPADLVAGAVTIPPSAVAGQKITIAYQVSNNGPNQANGSWFDSLYLSPTPSFSPSAALLGKVLQNHDLQPTESYTGTLTAPLPALAPGSYYVILRTNILNNFPEATQSNNLSASLTQTSFDALALTLGAPTSGMLTTGQSDYYKVVVTAGQTLKINLATQSADSRNELYVSFGALPTRGKFDFRFDAPGANQQITVPTTQAGTYYILAYGATVPGAQENYTITAAEIPFSITAASPGRVDNGGPSTLEIQGALFGRDTTFQLLGQGGKVIQAQAIYFTDSATAFATFDLTNASAGAYDMQAKRGDGSTALVTGAVTIVSAAAWVPASGTGTLNGALLTNVSVPSIQLVNTIGSFTVAYTNTAGHDLAAPLLTVSPTTLTSIGLSPDDVDDGRYVRFFGVSPSGPAGILRPGETVTKSVYFLAPATPGDDYQFELQVIQSDDTDPIDWNLFEQFVYPTELAASNWPATFAKLQTQIGSTWGGFAATLARNATLLPASEGDNTDLYTLLDLQVQKAKASVTTSLSGAVAATDLGLSIAGLTVLATNQTTGKTYTAPALTDGSFVFPDVVPGTYDFDVAGAVAIAPISATVAANQALGGIAIPVTAGAEITGLLTEAQGGKPVTSATITATNEADGSTSTAQSDASGAYLLSGLKPGIFDLVVKSDRFAPATLSGLDVSKNNGVANFQLIGGASITGSLQFQPGGPNDGVTTISASLESGGEAYTTQVLTSTFQLGGLPAGTYDVFIETDGYVRQRIQGVTVAAGQPTDIGVVRVALGASIAGQIVGINGAKLALAGQNVGLFDARGNLIAGGFTDSLGNFSFSALPAGSYSLQLAHFAGLYPSSTVTVAAGDSRTGVDIDVNPGGVVTGLVSDANTNSALAGVTVSLRDSSGSIVNTVADGSGHYRFAGLAAGPFTVYLPSANAASSSPVSIAAIDGTPVVQDLAVVSSCSITGSVQTAAHAPVEGATVNLFQSGRLVATAYSDSNGKYGFLLSSAGAFDLQVTNGDGSYVPATVSVQPGANVTQNFLQGGVSLKVTLADATQTTNGSTVLLYQVTSDALIPDGVVIADASGLATFSHLSPGTYLVSATGPTGRGAQATVVIAGTDPVLQTLTYLNLAALSGVIADSLGQPIANAQVQVEIPGQAGTSLVVFSQADGSYSFTGLIPGSYDLTVFANGFQSSVQTGLMVASAASQNVVLQTSTTLLTGSLVDSLGRPMVGASIAVTDASGHRVGQTLSGADGSFAISTASGNSLTLTAALSGYATIQLAGLSVPAGQTTSLGAETVNPIAIAIGENAWGLTVPSGGSPPTRRLPTPGPGSAKGMGSTYDNSFGGGNLDQSNYGGGAANNNAGVQGEGQLSPVLQNLLDRVNNINNDLAAELKNLVLETGVYLPLAKAAPPPTDMCSHCQEKYDILQEAIKQQEKVQQEVHDLYWKVSNELDSLEWKTLSLTGEIASYAAVIALFLPGSEAAAVLATLAGGVKGVQLVKLLAAIGLTGDIISKITHGFDGLIKEYNEIIELSQKVHEDNDELEAQDKLFQTLDKKTGALLKAYLSCLQQDNNQQDPNCPCNNMTSGAVLPAAAGQSCKPPPPKPKGPKGGGGGGHGGSPRDPNGILGPDGFGDEHFVPVTESLGYTITFENQPAATLPAQQVIVTQQLDADLNWQSFRLGSFGFGGNTYTVPDNSAFFQTQIDLTATAGFYLDVTGAIDPSTGIATWTFTTIDPETGLIPVDPTLGFLPPDDNNGKGAGFVSYVILAKPTATTGTVIDAQATITFYSQPPLDTPKIFNTIDTGNDLTSTVAPLPGFVGSTSFQVSWSGTDAAAGSAISTYSILASDNGGPFTLWLEDTSLTSATYTGQAGHTYAFYSVATNNSGLTQPRPAVGQASTTIDLIAPTSKMAVLPSFETPAFNVSWAGQDDTGGSGIAGFDIFVSDNGGAYSAWLTGTTQTSATYQGVGNHNYNFYSVAIDKAGNREAAPATADATTLTALTTASKQYVDAVYVDVLGRSSDLSGLSYWSGQLDGGGDRALLINLIDHSAEYFSTIIKPAYLQFLGRGADQGGLDYWIDQMIHGLTDEQLEAGFIGSPEYYQHAGGTDKLWVDAMYQNLLGRKPDPQGESFWTGQLGNGVARAAVALGFAASPEREGQHVMANYQKYLGRSAGPTEIAYWVDQFTNHGKTNEDVVTGFVSSDEYYKKHTGG